MQEEAYPVSAARSRKTGGESLKGGDKPKQDAVDTLSPTASPDSSPSTSGAPRKRDVLLGPTQRSAVDERVSAAPRDPQQRSLGRLVLLVCALAVPMLAAVVYTTDTTAAVLPRLAFDVLTLRRGPWSAMDNPAAAFAILWTMLPLIAVDYTLCASLCSDSGGRWFLLHSIGNLVVAAVCVPDIINVFGNPPAALSVEYCRSLGPVGCSDWPTCIIIAMHLYHMLSFKLSADDLFHHLLFVPIIGGINFCYPLGTLGNVLCFFISGLPGGIDYMMLSMVKMGKLTSYTEKRINCSINTWLRGPGITTFCALCIACWSRPYPGTPPEHMLPQYLFWPIIGIIFFNGQYYAQRVIGNYYIRKAQDYAKRGITHVELHAS